MILLYFTIFLQQTSPEPFDNELPPISLKELKDLISQVPELLRFGLDNQQQGVEETTLPRFRRTRSLSYDDLPSIKQFNVEQAIDEDDLSNRVGTNSETLATAEQVQAKDNVARGS